MARKIAPTLEYVARNYGSGYTADALRRELRALLAVARAADRIARRNNGVGAAVVLEEVDVSLLRALARLDKVSGSKP